METHHRQRGDANHGTNPEPRQDERPRNPVLRSVRGQSCTATRTPTACTAVARRARTYQRSPHPQPVRGSQRGRNPDLVVPGNCEAANMGAPRPSASVFPTRENWDYIDRGSKKNVAYNLCVCGCETPCKGLFAPGHDQRVLGWIRRAERNEPKAGDRFRDIQWYAITHPDLRSTATPPNRSPASPSRSCRTSKPTRACADLRHIAARPLGRSSGRPFGLPVRHPAVYPQYLTRHQFVC